MDRSKSVIFTSPKDYFSSELKDVFLKRNLLVAPQSFDYIVNTLVKFIDSKSFFPTSQEGKVSEIYLVTLYQEYLEASNENKKIILQRLGDICLMLTGFFSESLNRKITDIDYYFGMGESAYGELSKLYSEKNGVTFEELSVKFKPFSQALEEVSHKSGLQNNQDLIRLYERWNFSGSQHLKEILAEKGIHSPIMINLKTKH